MNPFQVKSLFAPCVAVGLFLAAIGAHAQTIQNRPIRLIVPFAAASSTDAVARIIAPGLGERLGTTIIVEDRPGANGVIGADMVAKSAPDGLTFLVGSASVNAVNPSLYKALPNDPIKDLVPIVRIGVNPFMLVSHPSVPFSTVSALIEYAKRNPGKLACATANSVSMVAMEAFKRSTGTSILTVPYNSSSQAMIDLVGNQVQLTMSDFVTAMPQVAAGKARVIAVTTLRRSPLLPDVPAISDAVKGFDIAGWSGLFAPRGTSPDVIDRVSHAVVTVLAAREIQDKVAVFGLDISSPIQHDEFGRYVPEQLQKWRSMIEEAGIKPQ